MNKETRKETIVSIAAVAVTRANVSSNSTQQLLLQGVVLQMDESFRA